MRPFGQVGVALHDRRGRPDTQLHTQHPIDVLGQTTGSADNSVGSFAGNGVAGQAECMLGALIAQVYGDHDGDAECYSQN